MEQKALSAEPRRSFSNEFKLQMVKLASQPGASVARIAREHDINDNLLFKWLRLWQNGGRISRRLPWICPYISRHLLSLNPLQARCRRYSRGER